MGKEEKMVQWLLSLPADYSYSEARALALRFGYIEQNKGSTSGSRVIFFRPYDKRKILLHKPHPGDIMKKYAVRQFLDRLIENGDVKDE